MIFLNVRMWDYFYSYVGDVVLSEALDQSIAIDLIIALHFHSSEGGIWNDMIGQQFIL